MIVQNLKFLPALCLYLLFLLFSSPAYSIEHFENTVELTTKETAALCSLERDDTIFCENIPISYHVGGFVNKIISGKIVMGRSFSWITQTKTENYLCVADNSSNVTCENMDFENSKHLKID